VTLATAPLTAHDMLHEVPALVAPCQEHATGVTAAARRGGPVPVTYPPGADRRCLDDLAEPGVAEHPAFAGNGPLLQLARRSVGAQGLLHGTYLLLIEEARTEQLAFFGPGIVPAQTGRPHAAALEAHRQAEMLPAAFG